MDDSIEAQGDVCLEIVGHVAHLNVDFQSPGWKTMSALLPEPRLKRSLAAKPTLGFESMRERIRLVAGRIRVHSLVGHGTRIDVRVPLPRVLLADDYESMLAAWRRVLQRTCDIVGTVHDADELLETALRVTPDVIVLDLGMVRQHAAATCSHLHQVLPDTRIVLASATDDPRMQATAQRFGAAAFVQKNAELADIHRAIGIPDGTSMDVGS